MEAMFHFVFQIIKISILSLIYTPIIIYLRNKYFLDKTDSENETNNPKKHSKIRLRVQIIIWIALFIWMHTYWGDHGLGDFRRIPLGYGKSVKQIDLISSYISPNEDNFQQHQLKSYSKQKHFLIAESDYTFENSNPRYFVWNLKNGEIEYFNDFEDYDKIAEQNKLSKKINLQTFDEHYRKYWSTWRFYLLP